jgi:hypothetical protein
MTENRRKQTLSFNPVVAIPRRQFRVTRQRNNRELVFILMRIEKRKKMCIQNKTAFMSSLYYEIV